VLYSWPLRRIPAAGYPSLCCHPSPITPDEEKHSWRPSPGSEPSMRDDVLFNRNTIELGWFHSAWPLSDMPEVSSFTTPSCRSLPSRETWPHQRARLFDGLSGVCAAAYQPDDDHETRVVRHTGRFQPPGRISFLTVSIWWIGFAQITFRRLPKFTYVNRKSGTYYRIRYKELQTVYKQVRKSRLLHLPGGYFSSWWACWPWCTWLPPLA